MVSIDYKEWLNHDELGISIFEKKYQHNGETFDEWLDRVSGGDAEIRELIKQKKFLFGGRILANRGTDKHATMMNCYSRGFVEDSLDDIMQANTDIAMTFKAQGGQGLSLSKLRPKGCGINHGQFKSDGIIPFMEIFNRTTESISQGGSRKGALIMTLDIWHKEAEDFIRLKSEDGRITKANLSLEIDDEFMKCVEEYYETGVEKTIHIKRDYGGEPVEYDVTPIKLYKLMMQKAYDWGEPGCIFSERFRNYNIMEYHPDYKIESCNPCSEQPLPKHGACCLGSINLSEFVLNPFTKNAEFDYDDFSKAVQTCIAGLDAIVDENGGNHALAMQAYMSGKYRNIGLGIMGLYDMFVKLGVTYGSQESIDLTEAVMKCMFRAAVLKSYSLAAEKGTFGGYKPEVFDSKIIKNHFSNEEIDEMEDVGLRNCSLLSVAPSGTIASLINCSSGVEPAFSLSYTRKTESLNDGEDKYFNVDIGVVKEYKKIYGEDAKLPDYFKTAHDIDWNERLKIQSALQNSVDTAISSTVNLKNDIRIEEIEQLYLEAWRLGLKGVTVFRDGCNRKGILTYSGNEKKDVCIVHDVTPLQTPENPIGKKRKIQTGCGSLHCLAFFDSSTGRLMEVYLGKGSDGGCNNYMNGLARMISLAARSGVSIFDIVDQLNSTGTCPSYAIRRATKRDTSRGSCCPMAIGNALIEMWDEMQDEIERGMYFDYSEDEDMDNKIEILLPQKEDGSPKCPVCGVGLVPENGCWACKSCGWQKCGG